MKPIAVFLALLFFLGISGAAESLTLPVPCQDKLDAFYSSIKSGEHRKALQDLLAEKLKAGGGDELMKVDTVLENNSELTLGKLRGYEVVRTYKLAASYLVTILMYKYEQRPLFLKVRFYKPDQAFIVDTIEARTSADEMEKEWLERRAGEP